MSIILKKDLNYGIIWIMGDKMGRKESDGALVRFDLLLPRSTIKAIKEMAAREAIAPRTLGRSLLVKKVRELEDKASGG